MRAFRSDGKRRAFSAGLTATPRGLLFLTLGSAVLAAGIVRSELAALFWGASILAAFGWAAAGVRISAYLIEKRVSGLSFSLSYSPDRLFPGGTARSRLRFSMPRPIVPGFAASFVYRVITPDGKEFTWRARLFGDENSLEIDLRIPARGEYSGPSGFLALEDVFGFAAREIALPGNERFVVYPILPMTSPDSETESRGGEVPIKEEKKRRSDEHLETRKYLPGDDTRRLNWKLYAHANELMLRIGEEEEQPESLILLYLDPATDPAAVPPSLIGGLVDRMATIAAGMVATLPGRGRGLLLSTPSEDLPLLVEPGKPENAMLRLARLQPSLTARPTLSEEAPRPPERFLSLLSSQDFSQIIVLYLPGSPSIFALQKALGTRDARFYCVSPGTEETSAPPRGILGFFLLPDEAATGGLEAPIPNEGRVPGLIRRQKSRRDRERLARVLNSMRTGTWGEYKGGGDAEFL